MINTNFLHSINSLYEFEMSNLLSFDAPIFHNLPFSITNIGFYLNTAVFVVIILFSVALILVSIIALLSGLYDW